MEHWGFNRHLGRTWSVLFLSPKPLSASELQELLSLSAGTVSAGLTELQTWGVVKRSRIAGDRNLYFEAEQQIWKSISNVLRVRELRILEQAKTEMESLSDKLSRGSKNDRSAFQAKRVQHISEAVATAQALVGALTGVQNLSLPKLNGIFRRLKSL